jgi:Na+/H+-dicarboxylate symporter
MQMLRRVAAKDRTDAQREGIDRSEGVETIRNKSGARCHARYRHLGKGVFYQRLVHPHPEKRDHAHGDRHIVRFVVGMPMSLQYIFIFVVLGLIARLHGFSIWKFIKYIKEELLIVLGTSSSESVLPRMMAKLENLGVKKSVVGLVIPTGYSFNLDGNSIYLTMAAVFIAQATNTPMTLLQQITLLAVLLLTSKGAAGITGSGFIVLAATLSAVGGVPVAGLALILGIDRFMSEARALRNLIGNGVATVVVGKWTGDLNGNRMHMQRNHETLAAAEEPEAVLVQVETHMPEDSEGKKVV